MTVEEMIAALQKLEPKTKVRLVIGNPDDAAITDDVTVDPPEGGEKAVTIRGWVSSDNESAFAPWGETEE